MKTKNRQFDKRSGSALILVVVVTVLLAVVGVMFLMVSRASELETGAVIQSADLDNAVDSVVAQINEVLVEDLFGNDNQIVDNDPAASDEPYDVPNANDPWLASLEPYAGFDTLGNPVYFWQRITDLYGNNFGNVPLGYYDPQSQQSVFSEIDPAEWNGSYPELAVDAIDTLVKVIKPHDRTYPVNPTAPAGWAKDFAGARADADGDGVADSRWVPVPGLTTSRGEPIFAALRIIDNCAMLNLNTAHCFYQEPYTVNPASPFVKQWFENETAASPYHDNQSTGSGRYLTEINYLPFLRGADLGAFWGGSGDGWYNLMQAKGFWNPLPAPGLPLSPQNCQSIVMNIEKPVSGFQFFDIGDELELRNRYLVTSKTEARFEQDAAANYTLDSGNGAGGAYAALEVPRDTTNDFGSWTRRIDSFNFDRWDKTGLVIDATPDPYEYDRRHVCTFYSYDRDLRGNVTYPEIEKQLALLGLPQEQADQIRWLFCRLGAAVSLRLPLRSEFQTDSDYAYGCRAHLVTILYTIRAYYVSLGFEIREAALKSAQFAANLIDYSDFAGSISIFYTGDPGWAQYPIQYPEDCTFLNAQIINQMVIEVARRELGRDKRLMEYFYDRTFDFGLEPDDIVFGYEKQPFISEVYCQWDNTIGDVHTAIQGFAIELLNPYSNDVYIDGWKLQVGDAVDHDIGTSTAPTWFVPGYDMGALSPGRFVFESKDSVLIEPGGVIPYPVVSELESLDTEWFANRSLEIKLLRPAPQWVQDNRSIAYLVVDSVSTEILRDPNEGIFGLNGRNSIKRDDNDWKFVNLDYETQRENDGNFSLTLGQDNDVNLSGEGFQLAVADDGLPLTRWHELETLALYGNGPELDTTAPSPSPAAAAPAAAMAILDPNAVPTVTWQLANLESDEVPYFDLAGDSSDLLNYVTTSDQTESGTVPGRININTAPVHVIAAAIPPTLADPNAADPDEAVAFSALQLAQEIVNYRESPSGPFESLSELLDVTGFKQYDDSGAGAWMGENVGTQSIEDDIEEEHWVLSNLANKFTVRSDVFTAYILVRLGETGPQRRMIGIFDRSGVWEPTDRPKLVALHPVPDPR
ncbi:MAG: general secretion pathway protein GspK [Phycisphaerae bacterium]|nr:general secretion pathway protein GspK [Phycisphaerae bacterium]